MVRPVASTRLTARAAALRSFAFLLVVALWLLGGPARTAGQQAAPSADAAREFFRTSDRCIGCHTGLTTPAGEDVSIGTDWRASMMANSARDPYWQAAVRREVMDHPEAADDIQNECSICHMPMARFTAVMAGRKGRIFDHLPIGAGGTEQDRLAADGVSCTLCHQITDQRLGEEESFVGGFAIDTAAAWGERQIFGPFDVDEGRTRIMRSASHFRPTEAEHLRTSELCATCHTLFTHSRGPGGEVIARLPEQMPYLEWRHSDFRRERSCQDCHMPVVQDSVPITGVLGEPRPEFSRHVFRGGNFFMLRMLNRYRHELGVQARPLELDAAVQRTIAHLQSSSARVSVEGVRVVGGRLEAEVVVENLAGHKLPTAYPSRRAWLHVTVRDGAGNLVFESGALEEGARIVGNDNDADSASYEPHYRTIDHPEQVQIYEAIMVGPSDEVTTGLLTAVRFVKDNRVLPRGFDPATASEDIAVQGHAADDADFVGGADRVRYLVDLGDAEGPFALEAELWYQPIAYRWARNLESYDAPETRRFLRYYGEMSEYSALRLARGTAVAR